MKKALLIIVGTIIYFSSYCLAQKINIEKQNGLVSVNGKNVFYLIPKNNITWQSDYALENLDHKQLAYFKLTTKYVYNSRLKSHDEVQYYILTFDQTGDHCDIKDYMEDTVSIAKALATEIIKGNVVEGDSIDESREKEFVKLHQGKISTSKTDTLQEQIIITIKGNEIYNNGELIGTYKTLPMDELTALQVYNASRNRVAEVTHVEKETNWTVITPVDQEKFYVVYDVSKPLENLFKALVEKKYL